MFGLRKEGECPTPTDLKIIPREMDFDLAEGLKKNRYWFENDPVKTHFFHALQAGFPEGERIFIDAARDVAEECKKPLPENLKAQLKLFVRQEAIHGKHHEGWNDALVEMGYSSIAEHNKKIKNRRLLMKKKVPALLRLASTAAAEHFTSSLGRLQLHTDRSYFDGVARPFRDMLLYHAIEEIEHKAVCFDLYEHAGGGYFMRMFGALSFVLALMPSVRRTNIALLKSDGLWNKETQSYARKEVWGRKGLVMQLLPDILDYLRPGFHPWEKDDRKWLLSEFSENFEEYGIESPSLA